MEFVRRIAPVMAFVLARFDPNFCGKVVRATAAVSVIEFLLTVALITLWLPADSRCRGFQIAGFLYLSGAPALWLCILAIFWKPLAVSISEWESTCQKWLLPPAPTAVFTVVFVGFAAFSALPFVMILQEC